MGIKKISLIFLYERVSKIKSSNNLFLKDRISNFDRPCIKNIETLWYKTQVRYLYFELFLKH